MVLMPVMAQEVLERPTVPGSTPGTEESGSNLTGETGSEQAAASRPWGKSDAGQEKPVDPLRRGDEVVKKAVTGDGVLFDPTKPLEEIRPAEVLRRTDPESLLLPGAGPGVPDSGVQRVQPVTASTPFPVETRRGEGPVVVETDLVPEAAVSAIAPEQLPPDFLDEELIGPTDPWVFTMEAGAVYDDNIRLSNRNREADFLFLLKAAVAWQRGDVSKKRGNWVRAYYEATGIAFAEDSSEDSIDHDAQLGGQRRWNRLSLVLEGRYQRLSGATPDIGDRAQRDVYSAKLAAAYELGGRTFVEGAAGYQGENYQDRGLVDYEQWMAEFFAGYELSGRTRLAVGGAAGRLSPDGAGRQNYQQVLVKVARSSSGALGLTGRAGAEFRQYAGGRSTTPVFSLRADWEPVADSTRVSVEGFRETVASGAMAGVNYLRTGGALRISQRLGSRFVTGLESGYERLDYQSIAGGAESSADRTDDYYFARASLRYEFDARRRAEIHYSFRGDDSSLEEFSFMANQWGVSFGLDF